ncbi:MAG: 50S ribosomal protein L10 [Armatimonadota bacterium]|nr:50S ribosomal protein L10 [Armatimonadota bacterium]
MVRPEKVAEVEVLKERLQRARAVILTDFRGLTVKEITQLRARLREAGVEYRVVKNRLMRIAARQAGIPGLEIYLEGPIAAAFGYDDPVTPARVVHEFIRQMRKLEAKGGIAEGRPLTAQQVRQLADLPPRGVLLAQVAGGMRAPLQGLASVLAGVPRALVHVLEQIRRKREAVGERAEEISTGPAGGT